MDWLLDCLGPGLCLLLAALCGWAVMHERFQDGIVLKVGLVLVCLSLLAVAHGLILEDPGRSAAVLHRAILSLNLGLVIVGVAYMLRQRKGRRRRRSDWLSPPAHP